MLEQQGVTNIAVPASVFVQNPEFASPSFWTQTVQRLTQGPEAGGLHGNGIAGVRVQPGGQELVRGEDNTVESRAPTSPSRCWSRTPARARRPRSR